MHDIYLTLMYAYALLIDTKQLPAARIDDGLDAVILAVARLPYSRRNLLLLDSDLRRIYEAVERPAKRDFLRLAGRQTFAPPLATRVLEGDAKTRFLKNIRWIQKHSPIRYWLVDILPDWASKVRNDRPLMPWVLLNAGGLSDPMQHFVGDKPDETCFPFDYMPIDWYRKLYALTLAYSTKRKEGGAFSIEIHLSPDTLLEILRQIPDLCDCETGYFAIKAGRVGPFRALLDQYAVPIRILVATQYDRFGELPWWSAIYAAQGRIGVHYFSRNEDVLSDDTAIRNQGLATWVDEAASTLGLPEKNPS